MSKLTYQNDLPNTDELLRALAEAEAKANPVDDLLELSDDLREFEQRYQMTSPEFYELYLAGALDDDLQHCGDWAATYDLFVKTKRKLEAVLMRAAIELELPTPA